MLANGHDRRQSDRQLGEGRDKIGYVSYKKKLYASTYEVYKLCWKTKINSFSVAYDHTTMNTPVLV